MKKKKPIILMDAIEHFPVNESLRRELELGEESLLVEGFDPELHLEQLKMKYSSRR